MAKNKRKAQSQQAAAPAQPKVDTTPVKHDAADLRRVHRDLRFLAVAAGEAGWTLTFTSGNHPKLNPPRGMTDSDGTLVPFVTLAGSPSDVRGVRNAKAALRRAGVKF